MIWANYHSHCRYCDGSDEPEKYVLSALENNMQVYGFSSHAPLPYEQITIMRASNLHNYVREVNHLKDKYKDKIEILLGLEVDYIPGVMGPSTYHRDLKLDYTVGSIHYVDFFADGTPFGFERTTVFERGLREIFKGDAKKLYQKYFELTRQMIRQDCPDIVGHMDRIKRYNKNNRFFSEKESWYKTEVLETLQVIKNSKAVVELNTRGIYQSRTTRHFCPDKWILAHLCEMEIPIVMNSDAHKPRQVKAGFEEAMAMLKKISCHQLHILKTGGWEIIDF